MLTRNVPLEWIQMEAAEYFDAKVKIEYLVLWLNNWLDYLRHLTRGARCTINFL